VSRKTFELSVGDKEYKVDVEEFDGKRARVKVDGKPFEVEVRQKRGEAGKPVAITGPPAPPRAPAKAASPEPPQVPTRSAPSGSEVIAPMPGLILDVLVSLGDQVSAGMPVIKMEAMKMENDIPAPVSGTVKTISVKAGDNVATDETLMLIEQA
jgi:biotin carboxyl carrier protein